jgi:hypothetical protein
MCVALHTLCGSNCILLCSPRVLYWVSEDITCRRESRPRAEFSTGVSMLLIVSFCQSLMCNNFTMLCVAHHNLCGSNCILLFSPRVLYWVSEDITCQRGSRPWAELTTGVSILLIVSFYQSLMCSNFTMLCVALHILCGSNCILLFSP